MIHAVITALFVLFMIFMIVGFNREMIEKNEKQNQRKKDKDGTTH